MAVVLFVISNKYKFNYSVRRLPGLFSSYKLNKFPTKNEI